MAKCADCGKCRCNCSCPKESPSEVLDRASAKIVAAIWSARPVIKSTTVIKRQNQ